MRLWFSITLLLVVPAGCGLTDSHVKAMDTMRAMATDVAARMQDGSIGQFQVGGQAINPGIRVEAGMTYYASARYEGLSGQFMSAAQGQLGSRGDVAEFYRIVQDKSLTDAEKRALFERLVGRIADAVTATRPGG